MATCSTSIVERPFEPTTGFFAIEMGQTVFKKDGNVGGFSLADSMAKKHTIQLHSTGRSSFGVSEGEADQYRRPLGTVIYGQLIRNETLVTLFTEAKHIENSSCFDRSI